MNDPITAKPAPSPPRPATTLRRRAARSLARRPITAAASAYLSFTLLVLLFLRVAGDRWWPGTLLLFGPRWVIALPLLVLIPLTLWKRSALATLLLAASLAVVAVVVDFHVPWRLALMPSAPPAAFRLRVMTCNIHRHDPDPHAMADAIISARPDVIVLQESSSLDPSLFTSAQWNVQRTGELLVASTFPIEPVDDLARDRWGPGNGAIARFTLRTPRGPVPILNVHFASPHEALAAVLYRSPAAIGLLTDNFRLRRLQADFTRPIAQALGPRTLIAGDFNTPSDSPIARDAWDHFTNAFDAAGWGTGHTYHARSGSARIDQILAAAGWRVRRCAVGPNVGSAHSPVIADLEWVD